MGKQPGAHLSPNLLKRAGHILLHHPLRRQQNQAVNLNNGTYGDWDATVFQKVRSNAEWHELASANIAALVEFEKLRAEWQRVQYDAVASAEVRLKCCVHLEHAPEFAGLLFPTFEELFANTVVCAALVDFKHSPAPHNRLGTYDNFDLFELNFLLAKEYIRIGGTRYLVELLKENNEVLYHDNVVRVEYSVGLKKSSAPALLSAMEELERNDTDVVIRILASFRGVDQAEDMQKLDELVAMLRSNSRLRHFVVGIDLVGDELARTYMPFAMSAFLDAAEEFHWGIRIHLGEAITEGNARWYEGMVLGLDAAQLAIQRGLKVRLGHGVYLQHLIEGLKDGIPLPESLQSSLREASTASDLADRILEMLRGRQCTLEACINSNFVLFRGNISDRLNLLSDFLFWLIDNDISFCFGADDPGITGDVPWSTEIAPACTYRLCCAFALERHGWYCEWLALHLLPFMPEAVMQDVLMRARQRSLQAYFA